MRVQLIAKHEREVSGTSRYTRDLYQGLTAAGLDAQLTFTARARVPARMHTGLKWLKLDAEAFFASYPLRVELDGASIYHLTSQMLATLLLFQRFPRPIVVTVLDIIPYLVRHRAQLNTFRHPAEHLFYRLALAGLRRADALIAISEYTRQTLIGALKLPAERIRVIYPCVDRSRFSPQPVPAAFRQKYGLRADERHILYVGSEDPRKNLSTLIQAFAIVKQRIPNIKLLKVGSAQFTREREKLLDLIAALHLQSDVVFFNYVPDEDLPFFYNITDVFAMPSLYEGFGLPVAEAMACGTPVICARAGSLPEVVGEAGCLVQPCDAQAWAEALLSVLHSPDEQRHLTEAGLCRATHFTPAQAVCQIQALYASLIGVKG